MLIRIVRMTFRPDKLEAFLDHFDTVSSRIRAFPGCEHLELWQDARYPNICTTYSHWVDQAALDAYRDSDLFRAAWTKAKPLFAARPEAHSYSVARSGAAIDEQASSGASERE